MSESAPSFPLSLYSPSCLCELRRLRSQRCQGTNPLLLFLRSDGPGRENPAPATRAARTRLPWQRRDSASSIRASLTTPAGAPRARAGADGSQGAPAGAPRSSSFCSSTEDLPVRGFHGDDRGLPAAPRVA
ncbi:hypothetical protein HJG60_009464 [Phyllostomus discolor]|uniref:Uncharacterized protein n=1 Tax=Phyllostomus discolor TaxID=89673 RepID=A0A834DC39_9CHIR|nr:hypothetical protein HJG60_009464 [Phyllostomus discolor]